MSDGPIITREAVAENVYPASDQVRNLIVGIVPRASDLVAIIIEVYAAGVNDGYQQGIAAKQGIAANPATDEEAQR